MEFKKGFTIKPKAVNSVGEVIFTDGTNDVVANQRTCEAYGYTFNATKGTCEAFIYNTKINRTSNDVHNIIKGANNTTNEGTETTFVLGKENTTFGDNLNSIITGEKNQIELGVNNAAVISGSLGRAMNQGEFIMAGGGFGNISGSAQTSFIQQSGNTEDNTETLLYTQYITNKYIEKCPNSVMGFEIHIVGVNTGVGAGTAGDYGYIQVLGAATFTNGLASTYHQHQNYLVNSGTSGLHLNARMKDASATSFGVAVTGVNETYIQWAASIRLWTNKIQQTF
jgi:hypothetical protein